MVSVLGRFVGVFHLLTSQMGVAVSQSKKGLQDGAPVAEGGCDSVVAESNSIAHERCSSTMFASSGASSARPDLSISTQWGLSATNTV